MFNTDDHTTSPSPAPRDARPGRRLDDDHAQLRAFLQALTSGADRRELLEVREHDRRRWRQYFHRVDQLDDAARAILEGGSRRDVYVGVATRVRARGNRAAIARLRTLWVDADTRAAVRQLDAFTPAPSITVSSGRGRHAYWLLRDPVSVDAGEGANARLARHLGADHGCFDAPRVLRPPQTRNFKYRPPTNVELLALRPDARYALTETLAQLPAESAEASREHRDDGTPRDPAGDPLLALEPAVYVRALLNVDVGPGGKVTCPFHRDRVPSLHVYPTAAQGWWCFSCRRGGSIYDLASALWGLAPRGALFLKLRDRLHRELGDRDPMNGGHHD